MRSAFARELGRDIEYHDTIPTTQTRARDLASQGVSRGIVVANEQTAGQGTRGRVWVAPKGASLLASWIVRPTPVAPALFAALAGVAIARALDALVGADARLEWPNDVHVGGRKVAGALAHATSDGDGGVLVLGIGINVHQRPDDFPVELRDRATSLAIAGHALDRLALLARLTRELDRLEDPAERGAALDEWRRRSTFLGNAVEVRAGERAPLRGIATAIDDDGALLVRTSSGTERVVAGEVALA
ncbi:MAG TPA: biotin--[acetyl-CoA-carboxylase] ligase [Candidatus Limnocylindria bacterium]|nr:biotin--[acetyl-CoA-carboxylase] ligase [Candidatus Limnocylindria bacterium]